ncbi:photosystem II oxygen evolving complex protein PsbP, partial [filamentous cyanobacterium CCP5]
MLRIAAAMVIGLTLMLQGCVSTPTSGLQSYADQYGGFEFMYPTGWAEVEVPGAADVVFHDIINDTENVSVVSSEVPEGTSLQDLGSPTE